MNKLTLAFLTAAFLLLILPAQATIYVGGDDGLPTISEAILQAKENETIFVYEGIYRENVIIDKPLILKAAGNVTVKAADNTKSVVWLKANSIVFSGFTVKGGYVGINLDNVRNCRIENNTAFGNDFGIGLAFSSDNSVVNNSACENGYTGLQIQFSEENEVWNNIFSKNLLGILLHSSNRNALWNNSASENGDNGLRMHDSEDNEVWNNILTKNSNGIFLHNSNRNALRNNSASENGDRGLQIQDSEENEVWNNIFSKNLVGIVLTRSNRNALWNNSASENEDKGLQIQDSEENEVWNNIFSKNLYGIGLYSSNRNVLRNNSASENEDKGLQIQESEENEVWNNIFSKNLDGIFLTRSNRNVLRNNSASENGKRGLQIQDSEENEVWNNIFSKNLVGIVLTRSNRNALRNNSASENGDKGLQIDDSEENEVWNNIFSKNSVGIFLHRSNRNALRNNSASENEDKGLQIGDSEENEVWNNIFSKNLDGVVLISSNRNVLRNNSASENGKRGLQIQDSEENEVWNNLFTKNSYGIVLISSNRNALTTNNIVDSKKYQARIQNSTLNTFDCNYWSDYAGEDKNKDGIGDEPYEIEGINQENDYDYHPYMNYSGWLNVVITPEYWEFYTKKGDIQYFYMNFSIENRLNSPTKVEIILDENLEFEAYPNGNETKNKTFSIPPKSIQNVTLRLNVTNLEGYILRKITFKTEDYTKTTLVNGLVQPKIHSVKIEGVDFHRNVVQGQINPFNVMLRNHGDRDVFNVTLIMGSKKSKRVYLNETRTVPFEIDTLDMPLGINKGQVVVSKDERLDHLNLTMFVASKLEASTLVVTNITRFKESEDLRHELIRLTHHPAVNGILLDVSCDYSEFDYNYKANKLCEEIKKQIEQVISEYPNIKYLIIVGDDSVIPFYRIRDGTTEVFTVITGLPNERVYYNSDHYKSAGPKHISDSVDEALSTNHFLTDDFYARLAADRVLAVGRLVEKPDEIIKVIDMFFNYYQLTPTNVFITGYDFMYDGSEECFLEWRKRIDTTFMYKDKKSSNYANPDEVISEIFDSSISAIFLHANYDEFEVPSGISVDRELLDVEEIRALNGSIIYTMGCHAGLTIPEVKDLPQSFLSNGTIAYIAPTGYGLGGIITVAGHEKLLEYLTKRIASGEEVGFALMNAKNDYYLDNFNQDKLDEKVMRSLTLYGFPMYAIRLDSPSIAALSVEEHAMKELAYAASNTTLEEATLTLKPSFTVYETENGTYYSYESYTTEAGMPILPKATWYFIRAEKEIRGIALRSARFEVNETRLAIETFAVSDGAGSENELKGWYPTVPFRLNTIEDRQNIVIASAQYKREAWWSKEGIIRLFSEIVLDIFRVPVDAEKEKPVVNVAIDTGVTVTAVDNAGIYDVFVTYLDSVNNSWESKCLGHSDSERKGVEYRVQLNNTVFFVQAIDVNGNVKIDDNNGEYYAC